MERLEKEVELRHVWHLGSRNPVLAILAVECVGKRLLRYQCSFCDQVTGHYPGRFGDRTYVVCAECGEVSIVVG